MLKNLLLVKEVLAAGDCLNVDNHLTYSIHYQSQGPLAFYKGFIPNFGRLGSWNVIMFLTLEQVKLQSLLLTHLLDICFPYL